MAVNYVHVILNVGLNRPWIRATQHSQSVARGRNLCEALYTSRALAFRVKDRDSALKLQGVAVWLHTFVSVIPLVFKSCEDSPSKPRKVALSQKQLSVRTFQFMQNLYEGVSDITIPISTCIDTFINNL